MSVTVADPPTSDPASDPLLRRLGTLLEAADAAEALGLDAGHVRRAHADAVTRLGFPSDAYVLALVGGTGVGKSTLLNALAGRTVSPASVRRPTTDQPIAWVPAQDGPSLRTLLEWLDVADVREHEGSVLGSVAILDLPDMDSVATAHRERVEAVLPRVDAVAWVTDPEKYHDAVLHDAFLRTWAPRLDRQVVVVNKADRLGAADRERVRRDLATDLARRFATSGRPGIDVLMVAAAPAGAKEAGSAEAHDLAELRTWLADGVAAKAVVRARVDATSHDLGLGLAREAGIDPAAPPTRFLEHEARAAALDVSTRAVLRAIDLPGLERQAVAATRAVARARGTGPMGLLTSIAYRASGRDTRVADPYGYLLRWRERAPLAPAVEPLRAALTESIAAASPSLRAALAAAVEPEALRQGLERAVDRAVGAVERLEAPTSRWWSLIGFLQTLTTAGIALSAAWVVVWILARPRVDAVDVPILGSIPMPFAALVVTVAAGYLLARLLGLHAGWVGRRWASRVRDRVADAVAREVDERALASLARLEAARHRLWTASAALVGNQGRREP
jgi:energy-coupling factor transporter ATP-binding protein EcfA2